MYKYKKYIFILLCWMLVFFIGITVFYKMSFYMSIKIAAQNVLLTNGSNSSIERIKRTKNEGIECYKVYYKNSYGKEQILNVFLDDNLYGEGLYFQYDFMEENLYE